MTMTPQQKLKWEILSRFCELRGLVQPVYPLPNVDEMFDQLDDEGRLTDAYEEVRGSGVETGLKCDLNNAARNYECKAVAIQMPDGTWVGWTYWYGGGKYGAPESVPWINDGYEVKCCEEEKVMVVQTFSRMLPSFLRLVQALENATPYKRP